MEILLGWGDRFFWKILCSVPFKSLFMFSLCLRVISAVITIAAANSVQIDFYIEGLNTSEFK